MLQGVVKIDADILGGTPVFHGTRVPVDSLTIALRAGDSIDEFLVDFPSVKRQQIEDYLEQAERTMLTEFVENQ